MGQNVYNTSKLAFHKPKLVDLSKGIISAPVYVRIKPTNLCNHDCCYCSYAPGSDCPVSEKINKKDSIPKEKMFEILDDFKEIGVKAITYSGGGEPLIYPFITETFRRTLDAGIELSIITNGQKLNQERAELLAQAEWVRISASESDAKTFSKTRKRPESWFYELRDNIKRFAEIKKPSCELGVNFVVHFGNFDKIYDSSKYFRDIGVNHIKITPMYTQNFEEYHSSIKNTALEQIVKARQDLSTGTFTVYDTYENDFNLTSRDTRNYSKCFIMQVVPVIGADSSVYFCHDKTYTSNGVLGSLKAQSFKELWFSESSKKIFSSFNPAKSCNHHCTYDSRNILTREMLEDLEDIERFKPPTDKHKNFI